MNMPPARTEMGEVLRRHGSDKAWPHCFDEVYGKLFPDRDAPLDILEVGLADGQSVRAWREYFPNARILGFDVEPCARINSDRIEVHQVEQTDVVGLWQHIGTRKFDWVIEDAAHLWQKQIITLVLLWPALKPGGWYCLEDVAALNTGAFSYHEGLGAFRGEFMNLNTTEYPDGGQLFLTRKS